MRRKHDGETYYKHLEERVGPALGQLVDGRASKVHGSTAAAKVAAAAEAEGAAGGSRRGRRAAESARSHRPLPIPTIADFGACFLVKSALGAKNLLRLRRALKGFA